MGNSRAQTTATKLKRLYNIKVQQSRQAGETTHCECTPNHICGNALCLTSGLDKAWGEYLGGKSRSGERLGPKSKRRGAAASCAGDGNISFKPNARGHSVSTGYSRFGDGAVSSISEGKMPEVVRTEMMISLLDIARPAKVKGVAKEFEFVQGVARVIALDEEDQFSEAFSECGFPVDWEGDWECMTESEGSRVAEKTYSAALLGNLVPG